MITNASMKLQMVFDELPFIIIVFRSRLFNNKLTDACTQHFSHLLKTKQDFLALRSPQHGFTVFSALTRHDTNMELQ